MKVTPAITRVDGRRVLRRTQSERLPHQYFTTEASSSDCRAADAGDRRQEASSREWWAIFSCESETPVAHHYCRPGELRVVLVLRPEAHAEACGEGGPRRLERQVRIRPFALQMDRAHPRLSRCRGASSQCLCRSCSWVYSEPWRGSEPADAPGYVRGVRARCLAGKGSATAVV